jgi:hypothetical protein
MEGYPPPPSFGPAPGQRSQALPFQYTTAQNVEYAYDRPSQSANISAFEQNAATLAPGFEYNTRPPPFNQTARAFGVPPLPIYGGLDPSALHQSPMWAAQTKPPGIPSPLEYSTTNIGPGQRHFVMQPESIPQRSAELTATRPGPRAVEEGELSEGEYEEVNVRGIAESARGETRRYNDYQPNRGQPSNGTGNQRQSSFEKMTPIPLTGTSVLLSVCIYVSK